MERTDCCYDSDQVLWTISSPDSATELESESTFGDDEQDAGFMPAEYLEEGSILRLQNGDKTTVAALETEHLKEPVKVYNLEVKGFHTFFVSDDSILVHNQCKGRKGKQARLKEMAYDPKVSKTLCNEIIQSKKKNGRYKLPAGYELAHKKRFEAYNGYGYENADLQLIKNQKMSISFMNRG